MKSEQYIPKIADYENMRANVRLNFTDGMFAIRQFPL